MRFLISVLGFRSALLTLDTAPFGRGNVGPSEERVPMSLGTVTTSTAVIIVTQIKQIAPLLAKYASHLLGNGYSVIMGTTVTSITEIPLFGLLLVTLWWPLVGVRVLGERFHFHWGTNVASSRVTAFCEGPGSKTLTNWGLRYNWDLRY